ncbi:hypothetical protein Pfo_014587 [Paulownia fortunei]|nr:hypothetical protein Pfo_014587 [Paulownia fortunei]
MLDNFIQFPHPTTAPQPLPNPTLLYNTNPCTKFLPCIKLSLYILLRKKEREKKMIKVGKMVELMEEYSLIMARMREQLYFLPRRVDFQFLRTLHSASTSTSADSSSFLMYF